VSFKVVDATPRLDQGSYPLLHMFHQLALAGGLAIMIQGKGGKFVLKVSKRYEDYLDLTMTEQYFFLLETLWIDADWGALQKATYERIPTERIISSVWQELAHSEVGMALNLTDSASPWHRRLGDWGYFLLYFSYFGFWQCTLDQEALNFSRRKIEATTLTPTEFGVFLLIIRNGPMIVMSHRLMKMGPTLDEVTIGELGLYSAFDYRDFCRANPKKPNKLLFVAHRKEILSQSLACFRGILKDLNFGSMMVGGLKPDSFEHLFVSIQSLNSKELTELTASDYYDYIVIDEFHHAAVPSYQELLGYYNPKILLGLTATPERADGRSIYAYFEGRIAAEIRLWEAIERNCSVSFIILV